VVLSSDLLILAHGGIRLLTRREAHLRHLAAGAACAHTLEDGNQLLPESGSCRVFPPPAAAVSNDVWNSLQGVDTIHKARSVHSDLKPTPLLVYVERLCVK